MLASELIKALQDLIAELGDNEVTVPLQGAPWGVTAPIKSIKLRNNSDKPTKTLFTYILRTK